jgi:hypothetical protein
MGRTHLFAVVYGTGLQLHSREFNGRSVRVALLCWSGDVLLSDRSGQEVVAALGRDCHMQARLALSVTLRLRRVADRHHTPRAARGYTCIALYSTQSHTAT